MDKILEYLKRQILIAIPDRGLTDPSTALNPSQGNFITVHDRAKRFDSYKVDIRLAGFGVSYLTLENVVLQEIVVIRFECTTRAIRQQPGAPTSIEEAYTMLQHDASAIIRQLQQDQANAVDVNGDPFNPRFSFTEAEGAYDEIDTGQYLGLELAIPFEIEA